MTTPPWAGPRHDNVMMCATGDQIQYTDQWATVLSIVECHQPGHSVRCRALHTAARVHHVDAGQYLCIRKPIQHLAPVYGPRPGRTVTVHVEAAR